jgi:hypothetical protein
LAKAGQPPTMKQVGFVLACLLFPLVKGVEEREILLEVKKFIKCNTAKQINIRGMDQESGKIVAKLWTSLSPQFYVTTIDSRKAPFNILVGSNATNLANAIPVTMSLLRNQPIKSFLLLLTHTFTQKMRKEMLQTVSKFDQNAMFYMMSLDEENMIHWYFILSIKGQKQVVLNKLKFSSKIYPCTTLLLVSCSYNNCKIFFVLILDERCIHEDYDLQGLEVTSVSLTWSPFVFIDNCDSKNNCQTSGMLLHELSLSLAKR